jgi:integrase
MSHIQYTIRRNETYHFNHRISSKVYRKSLKTDSPSLARKRVSDTICFIKKIKSVGRDVMKEDVDQFIDMLISNKVNEVARIGKAMTEPLSPTANTYFINWFRSTDNIRYNQYNYDQHYWGGLGSPRPEYSTYTDWLSEKMEEKGKYDSLYRALSRSEECPEREDEHGIPTVAVLDEDGDFYDDFQFPTIHSERYSHLDKIASKHAENIAEAHRNDRPVRLRMELEELKKKFAQFLPIPPPKVNQLGGYLSPAPLFEDIWEGLNDYLTNKSIKKGTISNKSGAYQDLIPCFTGIYLDQITFEDVESAWQILSNSPRITKDLSEKYGFEGKTREEKRKLRWEGMANGDIEEVEIVDMLKSSSLTDKKGLFADIFKWARRKNYIVSNPLDLAELDTKRERKTQRVALPIKYANQIITYCFKHLEDPHSFPILIMAYHGMRNSEVATLIKEQLVYDEESKVYYINITKGKTNSSPRKIPLHKALRRIGFIEYVDTIKEGENIFSVTSAQLTNYYFKKIRPMFSIPAKNEAGELLNLYSFRHNVISQFGELSSEYKYKLFGHADNGTNTTQNYTHVFFKRAQELINQITYEI